MAIRGLGHAVPNKPVAHPLLSFLTPMTRWLPFLIPPLYLAAILILQPADRLGEPPIAPWLERWVYDDYDEAAYALRGLNASLGRPAGRLDEPPRLPDDRFTAALREPPNAEVLRARYFLEYPHAALLIFRLGYWLRPDVHKPLPPAGLLDACHLNLVDHDPANDAPALQRLWRKFRQVIRLYNTLAVGCLLALMAILVIGYEPGGRLSGPAVLLLLPAMLYFTANRFDIVPALLTAVSFACLGRRQVPASAVFLGLATLVKVYPVLFSLLVLRYLSGCRKQALTWALAYGLTILAFLGGSVWLAGWEATAAPFRYQLSRDLESLTLYGAVLPLELGTRSLLGSTFRLGAVAVTILVLASKRPDSLADLLRRAAVVLLVFVALQVFYSPQWILWFAPLLIPLVRSRRILIPLLIGLDVVTYFTFPVAYDWNDDAVRTVLLGVLIYARVVALIGLAVALLRAPQPKTEAVRA
jgi:hypothetical protein